MRTNKPHKPQPIHHLIFLAITVALTITLSAKYLPTLISSSFPSSVTERDVQSDRLLLVTAYFPLKTSKHSHAEYDAWLTNFMGQIHTDMYIFCPPDEAKHLRSLIEPSIHIGNPAADVLGAEDPLATSSSYSSPPPPPSTRHVYFDTRFHDCIETPVLASFAKQAEYQWSIDTEKHINNPDLYAIWNSKPYFVGEAIRNTTSSGQAPYKYYFWQDAGAMRTPNTLQYWPSMGRADEVFKEASVRRGDGLESRRGRFGHKGDGAVGDSLILFPFWRMATDEEKVWTEAKGGIPTMLTEGSLFGGTASSLLWFESAFYELFEKILAARKFIGRDQDVFNTLIAQFPSHFFGPVAFAHLGNWGACGDRWYYYIYWLASVGERTAMERKNGWDCPVLPVDYPFW